MNMGLGIRMKQLRKQAGMTQAELAERIGVHETTIRRWEQERDKGPDGGTVNIIAEVLNTTPDYLLSDMSTFEEQKKSSMKTTEKELVYEWGGKNRIALPNTPETRELFRQLVMSTITNTPAIA